MRKILIFSLTYYPDFIGGAEVAIKEITDRISPQEIEFDMVTLGSKAVERIGNINVYRVGKLNLLNKLLFPISGTFKMISLLRKRKYDAFWAMMVTYSSGCAYIVNILRLLCCLKKIPIILSLQEGDSQEHIARNWLGLIALSWKLALKRTKHVTALSNYLMEEAKRYGYNGLITIVPNGVDLNLFSQKKSQNELDILKHKFGKRANDIFLITTSRLVEKNAVGDIIDSLSYLPENVKLLILGTGKLENILKNQVEKLKLRERVEFLEYIPHSEMPQYLHISDIFIRPSLSEGFGNSYIEAMGAGIPVIATPVGGIVDFLKDGETGLFCEVRNPRSIAQKVE
ncbi:MAG: glycosyltransferase, partial [Candidatus Taylorbacteria bacterium]|nr:glycosyltransferase [Candidatus Taylorbacteria bacterium]